MPASGPDCHAAERHADAAVERVVEILKNEFHVPEGIKNVEEFAKDCKSSLTGDYSGPFIRYDRETRANWEAVRQAVKKLVYEEQIMLW